MVNFYTGIFQVEYFSSSSRDNAILCKSYNHSKCVQNIVFYAGRQLNAMDLCKKPCQINTFQVSKSDINAEMQDKDYMGWVEIWHSLPFFLYIPYPAWVYTYLKYCILKNYTCVLFSIFMTVATSNVLVNEEYLLYDLNNIISAVGGSMGLFLSFSFLKCFMCAFGSLKNKFCCIKQKFPYQML